MAIDPKQIIKNVSYDQTEILHNIGMIYNNGSEQYDCDITASKLGFYNGRRGEYQIPVPKFLFDVYPQVEGVVQIEKWGKIPMVDNYIKSIVIDLPFVISPANAPSVTTEIKEGSNRIFKRFSSYYPVDNLYYSYYHWLKEAYRVLDEGGICIFKCQSQISGGVRHNIEEFSTIAAESLGFKAVDKFVLLAKQRLISANRYKSEQKHSRNFTSVFLVFKKDNKVRSKEKICAEWLEMCKVADNENYVNVVEK